jgi:hypothetical protein
VPQNNSISNGGTVAPVAAVAGGTAARDPLPFTGSSNLPGTIVGLMILAVGGALLALGLRGPLARRKLAPAMPPWLHTPVPSGARRRPGGSGGGRAPRAARKNKLPPWLHTGVPTRKRRFF